jgi:hypothetical protein
MEPEYETDESANNESIFFSRTLVRETLPFLLVGD